MTALMKVKAWGVGGSIPAPSSEQENYDRSVRLLERFVLDIRKTAMFATTVERGKKEDLETFIQTYLQTLSPAFVSGYPRDTTCIEIQAKDTPLIILDAGSGIRRLSQDLTKRTKLNPLNTKPEYDNQIQLFISHTHWDHIQGFPFFAQAFNPNLKIHFYAMQNPTKKLETVLAGQQQSPYFPVEWQHLPCEKEFTELTPYNRKTIDVGNVKVSWIPTDHPGGALGYRFETKGKAVAIATDHEHRDIEHPGLVNLAKDADVFFYDSQYLPVEYKGGNKNTPAGPVPRLGWGHSTYEWAIKQAEASLEAGTKQEMTLVLVHHEPARNDFQLEQLLEQAIGYAALNNVGTDKQMKIELARPEQTYTFEE
ncbi:MBL fold metallo-hydrolase [Candidatus Woesearchaeota archaeon]|nr:MBL fold metallo-hydrolase [Candidatus Woesearchaeota archaeon]